MIGKAKSISHGINNIRYITGESRNKKYPELIYHVKDNLLPCRLDAQGIWDMMKAHAPKGKNVIRIEISPAKEHTEHFTMKDWEKLWNDFVREYDCIEFRNRQGEIYSHKTNLSGSIYSVWLHLESKSGIPHLHAAVCRKDKEGRTNNDHNIHLRAQYAAERVARKRGWTTAMDIRRTNADEVAAGLMEVLRSMPSWSWDDYVAKIRAKGYTLEERRDKKGVLRGYTVGVGDVIYKASELGKDRNLMVSKIEATWKELHKDFHQQEDANIKNHAWNTYEELQTANNARCRNCNEFQSQPLVHHSINLNYCDYEIDIPSNANDILMQKVSFPENNVFGTINDLQQTAVLLFAGYLDAATQMSESSGGGGRTPDGWGRDKDEDDLEWARRCAKMASQMCRPAIKRGNRR